MLKVLLLAPVFVGSASLTTMDYAGLQTNDQVVTASESESFLHRMIEPSLLGVSSEFAFSPADQLSLAMDMHQELVDQGYTEKEAWLQLIDFLNNDLVSLIEFSVCPPNVTEPMALKNFEFLFDLAEVCEILTKKHTGISHKADTFINTLVKTFSYCN